MDLNLLICFKCYMVSLQPIFSFRGYSLKPIHHIKLNAMMSREITSRFKDIFLNNLREFHRRIIVIEDPDVDKVLDILNLYRGVRGEDFKLLVSCKEGLSDNDILKKSR